ncbi:MAG: dTDP-4-dehydrorhamnose reductase [Herminiimonas sp.]|nr:dTDP-4-dehydrorhamnose reductase [Herminiimonas sp.]
MKVLVLGISGMLGNAMFRVMSQDPQLEAVGTARSPDILRFFAPGLRGRVIAGVDVLDHAVLRGTIEAVRPDVVVNCVGLIKQHSNAEDLLVAVPVNAILPHRLAWLTESVGARLVHISTDCAFAGDKGNYSESEPCDAKDLYGKTKFLGEVAYPHTLTLRTSIIGHELTSSHALVDWFLSQGSSCKGFTRAIFSGFPTVVLSEIVRDVVLPRADLSGLYHVAARPIAKYDLLQLIAKTYGKQIEIVPDTSLRIDRSLDGRRFQSATGYVAPEWPVLVHAMHSFQ